MTEPRELPYDWGDIRQRLQADIWGLLRRLRLKHDLPTPPPPKMILPLNPMRRDRHAGSFVIWTEGAPGAWKDYAVATDKGDIFDLIAYIERLHAKIDVYWWALDFLGLDRKGADGQARSKAGADLDREMRERERLAHEARQGALDAERSASLFRTWLSLKPIDGTPAETYLRQARGIDLSRLKRLPGALRWARAVDWVDPRDGEVHEWRSVMVSAMTRGAQVTALHVTWLKPDGSGKAEMAKPKRMFGAARGAAIRLSAGPSGHRPTQAVKRGVTGPAAMGEGIETSLTVACARPDLRVWAAGSLSLMGVVDWHDCMSAMVLLAENFTGADPTKAAEAAKAFAAVERHWREGARGRPVEVARSAMGSDFNDWKQAG